MVARYYEDREQYDAMFALNGMDRELHSLCAPILWKVSSCRLKPCSELTILLHASVTFDRGFFPLLRSFPSQVAASKAQLVRQLVILHLDSSGDLWTLVEGYAQLLLSLPSLLRLTLHCRSNILIGLLLTLLPPSLPRTLRHLRLEGFVYEAPRLDLFAVATALYAFPELVSVHFEGINEGEAGGAVLAVNALRSLTKLLYVGLGDINGFKNPAIALPWKSSLIALDLNQGHGATSRPAPSGVARAPCHHALRARPPPAPRRPHFSSAFSPAPPYVDGTSRGGVGRPAPLLRRWRSSPWSHMPTKTT